MSITNSFVSEHNMFNVPDAAESSIHLWFIFFSCDKIFDIVFMLPSLCQTSSRKKERYCDAWTRHKLSLLQKNVKRVKLCVILINAV